jgi:hypothetical protein
MITAKMLSQGVRRAPGMVRGAVQGAVQGVGSMREALEQKQQPLTVAEILSQPLSEMQPDLMGAQGSASRQREIANLLMQNMQQQDNTSLAGGLSQLGQAFLARGAGKKADKAEAEAQSIQSLLVQNAMKGDQASLAQLVAGDPAAAIAQINRGEDREFDEKVFNTQTMQWEKDYTAGRLDRKFDEGIATRSQDYLEKDGDRTFGLSVDGFNEGMRQFNESLEQDQSQFDDTNSLGWYNANTNRYGTVSEVAAREAEAATKGLPKPLIGAESMARVAAGLPNAKKAVAGLRSLVFNSKGTTFSQEGYDPGSDWGAGLIQDLGHFPLAGGAVRGLTDPLSRIVGGADYQKFEDNYGTYEAALLPIMSGAAVTDTEALRQMRAVRIKSGDDDATKERKIAAMELQLTGLEMAVRGDIEGFLGLMDQAGELTGVGPVKRGGAAAPAAPVGSGTVLAPEFTAAEQERLDYLEAKRAGGG